MVRGFDLFGGVPFAQGTQTVTIVGPSYPLQVRGLSFQPNIVLIEINIPSFQTIERNSYYANSFNVNLNLFGQRLNATANREVTNGDATWTMLSNGFNFARGVTTTDGNPITYNWVAFRI